MTDRTLHDLLAGWELDRSQHRDHSKVTPSATATLCMRQAAYRINDVPQSDSPDPVTVATVGSLIHAGVALLWDEDAHTLATEFPLAAGGQIDAVRAVTNRREIRDLKTLSRSKFDAWQANDGPGEEVWQQLAEYASRYRAELGDQPVFALIIDALCRDDGRTATYEREWDEEQGEAATRTLARVEALRGLEPLDVPTSRIGRGDWLCDSCPWVTACMGPDDRTPELAELTEDQAVELAGDYAKWSALAREAKAKAEAARNMLQGVAGRVGEWEVTWRDVPERMVPPAEAYIRKGYSTLSVRRAKP